MRLNIWITTMYCVFILFVAGILACDKENESSIPIIEPLIIEDVALKKDTLTFLTPGSVKNLPFKIFSLGSSDPDQNYIGYNYQTHNIDYFNFNELQYGKITRLDFRGPNAITRISSLYHQSTDSIYILEENPNRIWRMDRNDSLYLEIDLKMLSENDTPIKGLYASNNSNSSPMFMRNNRLYFFLRKFNDRENLSYPIMGYYDLSARRVDTLGIYYPTEYHNDSYGLFIDANIVCTDDKIIVNFPISTEIYIYDLEGNLLSKVASLPGFKKTPPINPGLPTDQWIDHVNESPMLYPMMPYKNGKYYIQCGRDPVPNVPLEERYNTVFGYNLIYSGDFKKVYIEKVNKIFHSNGGDYMFHQLPIESPDTQHIERYTFEDF